MGSTRTARRAGSRLPTIVINSDNTTAAAKVAKSVRGVRHAGQRTDVPKHAVVELVAALDGIVLRHRQRRSHRQDAFWLEPRIGVPHPPHRADEQPGRLVIGVGPQTVFVSVLLVMLCSIGVRRMNREKQRERQGAVGAA